MNKSIFITGTDTGVGKTAIAGLLGRFLAEKGIGIITQKWVQTGCIGFSEDVANHIKLAGKSEKDLEPYLSEMAPYILEFPSSPHLAAELEKKQIDIEKIRESFLALQKDFDVVIVEGSGGLMVPIDDEKMIIDIVDDLALPVLIVAENRLGAINQTVLTVEALRGRGIRIIGIIFNQLSEDENELVLKDNPGIVEKLTGIEVLGTLPYSKDVSALYGKFVPVGEKILERL